MTADQAIQALAALPSLEDRAKAHAAADEILLAYLNANGGEAVVKSYNVVNALIGFYYL